MKKYFWLELKTKKGIFKSVWVKNPGEFTQAYYELLGIKEMLEFQFGIKSIIKGIYSGVGGIDSVRV